ncbi:MAG: thiamine pyrophosphate-binding protein [Pseudomonadota bacterium]
MTSPSTPPSAATLPRTGADIVGHKLAQIGCRRAFGIPGGEVLALMEGLAGAGIEFVLTKHENAAGFMAEGAWHAESGDKMGPPGILVATVGPGVANAVNVVANAMQDRVPLLFLTGCVDAAEAHRYTHQVFDHGAMLRPIVKTSLRAEPGAVGVVIDKAVAIALDGQPGPVHLDFPISAMEGAPLGPDLAPVMSPEVHVASTQPHAAAVERLDALLSAASRPLALLGVDAVNAGAGEAVAAFLRDRKIPWIASYKAKGLIDDGDPLSLGGAGLSPKADAILLPVVQKADLILLLGYDPIEMRKNWSWPWPVETPVIELTPALRTHGMHPVPTLTVTSDVSATLGEVTTPTDTTPWPEGEPATARAALEEAFAPEAEWGPARAFHVLRDTLPPETVATADSGAHRILLSQIWRCPTPRTLLQSSALCTMGCAVPLAMGHALARPGTPAVAFVGDAGLEMGLGELATARDLKLPVLIVTLVDESLALIEKKQRESQRGNLGVDFPGSDFPAIAAALGGVGVWVDDEASLRTEAAQAFGRDTFTLLAVRIGRHAYDGKI